MIKTIHYKKPLERKKHLLNTGFTLLYSTHLLSFQTFGRISKGSNNVQMLIKIEITLFVSLCIDYERDQSFLTRDGID